MNVRHNNMQNTSEPMGSRGRQIPGREISTAAQASAAEIEERIRVRAYELYLQRGMKDGFAEQDWLQAEAEILSQTPMRAVA